MTTLYDPVKIGTLELPNRMVAAPTVRNNANEAGAGSYIREHTILGYIDEAHGGWGMIQVGGSAPAAEGQIFRCGNGIIDDNAIVEHERLAYAIHREGTLCSLQILHGGALCNTAITGLPVVGPSETGGVFGPVKKMSTGEVEERVQMYINAAARAQEAGYDAVNIHCCQGSLVQQFMSPYTNDRDDKFGDPGLFPEMIFKGIKERCGKDYPVIMRLAAREFMEFGGLPGYDEEWGKTVAKRMEPWVDCFDVTGGRIGFTGMFAFPPVYAERATRVPLATEIKKVVSVPVMGVAKIMEPKLAEYLIESGKCDIAHFCRPAIADPHFAKKALEGRPEDIRKCISCNWCLETLFRQRRVLCAINPRYNREGEVVIEPSTTPKKVMIIGGGVAGMETAITLAQRNHKVDIYEKDDNLGGTVKNVASTHPKLHTRDLRNVIDYQTAQLKKLEGITVHLESEVTPEFVKQENPDAVVVAVGAKEVLPDIPGIDLDKVVTNEEYLRAGKSMKVGNKVVIIGGNYGAETAVSLARQGKEVTMIEESETHSRPVYITDLYSRLFQLDRYVEEETITVLTKTRAVEINDAGVVIEGEDGQKTLEADFVVIAYDREPCKDLTEALKATVKEVYEIGDCVKARDIAWAIDDASYVGRKI